MSVDLDKLEELGRRLGCTTLWENSPNNAALVRSILRARGHEVAMWHPQTGRARIWVRVDGVCASADYVTGNRMGALDAETEATLNAAIKAMDSGQLENEQFVVEVK